MAIRIEEDKVSVLCDNPVDAIRYLTRLQSWIGGPRSMDYINMYERLKALMDLRVKGVDPVVTGKTLCIPLAKEDITPRVRFTIIGRYLKLSTVDEAERSWPAEVRETAEWLEEAMNGGISHARPYLRGKNDSQD